jgi:NAD(P)-dependent dehydrogenase (short-subunit alcohol dehydrogenase family)
VTGASTGIGQATALRLHAAGWTVLAGVRSEQAGQRLAASGRGESERLRPVILDVTRAQDVSAAVEHVRTASGHGVTGTPAPVATAGVAADGGPEPGRLDALVNNAGISVGGPVEVVTEEDLRHQFEVNVFGQMALTRALLPALRAAHGRIVFLSSIGGRVVTPFLAPYVASKHAIEAFGDALRVELRSSGVQVALVEPGSVATPIWEKGRSEVDGLEIPPELAPYYGHVPAAFEKVLEDTERRAISPEVVAETIERALSSSRMRPRYLVGRDAKAMLALRRLLPDRAFDALMRRALGV